MKNDINKLKLRYKNLFILFLETTIALCLLLIISYQEELNLKIVISSFACSLATVLVLIVTYIKDIKKAFLFGRKPKWKGFMIVVNSLFILSLLIIDWFFKHYPSPTFFMVFFILLVLFEWSFAGLLVLSKEIKES